ncbi:ATP phosphoribosyltransferase regulatory subunit [Eubacteriaceae bacterium ES2]|nr:ATP phosphoribosyltransferase regulatory subunit [Eubacteriaceae bacterium ES2]
MLFNYNIEGFETIQPQNSFAFTKIVSELTHLYDLYGYQQTFIPTFESYDLYVHEDSIPSDELFKLVSHKGKVLTLKPDVTLPITRMVAINHPNPKEIIKFSYQASIYRNFSAPESIKKEINQIGIEYFGNDSPECDGEIIALSILSLLKTGISDIHIDLGHVGFINYLLEDLDFSDEQRLKLFEFIENKNIGDIVSYLKKLKIDPKFREIIAKLPVLYGKPIEVISEMKSICINEKMESVVNQITEVYNHLQTMGFDQYINLDLGFTNQMNYYSDTIFKVYINNWGEPVISGGRYNNLSEKFGLSRPACGFAIDLMKIINYMDQNNFLPQRENSKNIILYEADQKSSAYNMGQNFRKEGKVTELFIAKDNVIAQIKLLKSNPLYQNIEVYYLKNDQIYNLENQQFVELERR